MNRDPRYVEQVLAPRYAFACREELRYLLQILTAHTLMLRRQGLITPQSAGAILGALVEIGSEDPPAYDPRYEDMYFVIEQRVAAVARGAGDFRLALSRNDTWAALARLMLRDQVLPLIAGLDDLRGAVLDQAERHRDTLIMAHTHHQHAQPTTAAHYLIAAAAAIERCVERYRQAVDRLDRSPMGAAALTTTGFPIDRAYTAALLGFSGVLENSYDAVSAADHVGEVAGCHAVLATTLSRIVQDLLLWASTEVGGLELAPGFIQISSIMPQKRNPVALEHVRSELSRLLGMCAAIHASAHNVPFGDVNDPVDDLLPPLTDAHRALDGAIALFTQLVASARIMPEAWARALRGTFATSTELADTLVREAGLHFDEAHAVVTRLVHDRRRRGLDFSGLSASEVDAAARATTDRGARLSDEAVARAVDPQYFVARRAVRGGPAAQPVGVMLADARASLAASRRMTRGRRERIAAAREDLARAAAE
jgi:argininosuccinate lyase